MTCQVKFPGPCVPSSFALMNEVQRLPGTPAMGRFTVLPAWSVNTSVAEATPSTSVIAALISVPIGLPQPALSGSAYRVELPAVGPFVKVGPVFTHRLTGIGRAPDVGLFVDAPLASRATAYAAKLPAFHGPFVFVSTVAVHEPDWADPLESCIGNGR